VLIEGSINQIFKEYVLKISKYCSLN
jgi:hypothetical protein